MLAIINISSWSICAGSLVLSILSNAEPSSKKDIASPSTKFSIVDEILARPAKRLPEVYQHAQDASVDGSSSSSLSRAQVSAIYQDYIKDTSHKRLDQEQEIEQDEGHTDSDDYDYDSETYEREEENEVDNDHDLGEEDATLTLRPTSSQTDPMECSQTASWLDEGNKSIFRKAWKARGLSCKMDPRDLAKGVTQMKVDLLEYEMASSLGLNASIHIRKKSSPKYWNEYRFWTRRYGSVLKHKEESIKAEEELKGIEYSLEEKKKMILEKIAKAEHKTYGEWHRRCANPWASEVAVMERAKKAGEAILSIAREATRQPQVEMTDLSIAEIEYYSRGFDVVDKTKRPVEEKISKESIKRYLKRCLGKNDKDILEFSLLRSEWKLDYFAQKQQEKYDQNKSIKGRRRRQS